MKTKKKLFLFVCLRMGSLEICSQKVLTSFWCITIIECWSLPKICILVLGRGLALLWWHAKMPKTIFWCGCLLCCANGVFLVFTFTFLNSILRKKVLVWWTFTSSSYLYVITDIYIHNIYLLRFTRVGSIYFLLCLCVIHIISSKLRSNLFVMNADSIMGKPWKTVAAL